MRKNKGVTIVTLVIIIVVLLILAGVSAGIGNISVTSYKDNILETEAKEVQTVVISQYQKYLTVKDESLLLGTKCNKAGVENQNEEYYLLDRETLEKLGMKNPKDTYIVKYSTGEVINKTTPQNSKGEDIYLKGN